MNRIVCGIKKDCNDIIINDKIIKRSIYLEQRSIEDYFRNVQ
jgi:hypothetical protein